MESKCSLPGRSSSSLETESGLKLWNRIRETVTELQEDRTMRPARSLLVIILCASFSRPLAAAPDPTYAALRNARPDGRRMEVKNLALDRDVFHFQFDSGTFHLLAPVDGRTIG